MAMPVVQTKLFVPPPRSTTVRRHRLTERLQRGVAAGRRLSLISAPAGFGKTTVLSEWVAASRQADPSLRVAWLSLDQADNDATRFLHYLVAAFDLTDDPARSPEATLTALVNDAASHGDSMLLVLDDFQLIESTAVRDAVSFLLDHLPANLHLAIATRSDPLLPLARLRARGELTELRAEDLRFDSAEATAFLDPALSADDVAALEKRTEGWIAGLQLAALSLRERTDTSEFIRAFTGSNRFIIDFLVEEVLERAPLDVREFLCETAILNRLSGPLCDAVTGRAGGAEMLTALERANLFVIPLDDQRQWYRYHHLFADVLRVRLLAHGAEHSNALHRRARAWFEANGFADDAVDHAIAGNDFDSAARVIESMIPSVRQSRQDATLLAWLARLPPQSLAARPVLRVFSAWSSLLSGDIAAVEPQLTAAEALLGTAHDSEPGIELSALPVTIALYRGAVAMATGDTAAVQGHAQRALDSAAPDDHLGRGAAAGMLGLAAWSRGDLETGLRGFRESATSLRRSGNLLDALSTTMVTADMLLPLGRLGEAQSAYEAALAEAAGNAPAADLHSGLAEVLRYSDPAAAAEHLATAQALGSFSAEHGYRWAVAAAGVERSAGNLEAALDLLAQAEARYRSGFFAEARPIGGQRARVWILQGRLTEAREWVAAQNLDELSYLQEFTHITLARLLLAEREFSDAEGLLGRLADAAEAGGRSGSLVEILVLQALARHADGRVDDALAALDRALSRAEGERSIHVFIDEGAPMLQLLRRATGSDLVRMLSQHLRDTGAADTGAPIADPPSDRELHVLRLLATELSGPQIAAELHVSLNTMRTHTKHIFLKLAVNERSEAVRRAEQLGLI